ncbi:hypothetical protein F0562_008562 [Nyssa sinensis]|uniref:Uncharacterized protein n=1 Tax=Nyssa sinensis TaxID=561372 RepID=A0A5J5AA93_9ASTE|nr:hypothetical protein F0562_008562 [Nyssa sinensis]
MGHRCCNKQKVKRGLWSPEEDEKLIRYIITNGHVSWSSVPKLAGLQRCGKSCRLRWINYLRPDLKRGSFTADEEQIIIDVHRILGNRWAQIAKHLPGRTDNEVKNFWNSCIKKKLISQGLDPKTHNLIASHQRRHCVKTACNPSQTRQQPDSVFTVMTIDNSMEVNRSFVTRIIPESCTSTPLPPHNSQPTLQQTISMSTPSPVWTIKNQRTSHDFINFPCGSSFESTPINSSSSSCSINPSAFGFIDENCIWGRGTVEPLGAPGEEQLQVQELSQKEKICHQQQIDKTDEKEGAPSPYDSCSFDLEFMESTLMSGEICLSGEICRDLTTMDDLAWHF